LTALVLDASVLVTAVADSGPDGRWAEALLQENTPVAPDLALAEAADVLRRSVLAGALSEREATLAHRDLLDLDIELFPYAPFADRIWALRGALSIYDACYVALAEALELPLATLDRKLAKAPGPRCRIRTPGGGEVR
jgi:predicted nucleic acid-binding protein